MMRRAAGPIVFVIAFATYLVTLAPTVGPLDSGELTVAAATLGVPHPPGFPLYVLTTHVFTKLPLRSVAWRANLASAFFAALACAFVTIATLDFGIFAAIAAGLLFAFSGTLWRYATVAEVYALNECVCAAAVAALLAWRRTKREGFFFTSAILFGLGLADHYVITGITMLGVVPIVRTRRWPIVFACVAAPLLLYAYLPIAAAQHPMLNWGDPSNFSRFIEHVTAAQYRGQIGANAAAASPFVMLGRELHVFLLVAAFGLWRLWKRDRALFWALAIVILANVSWLEVYAIVNDRDAYLLPAILALCIAVAATELSAVSLVIPAIAFALALPHRNHRDYWIAEDYFTNTMRGVDQNGLVITSDHEFYGAALYFRDVEHRREDAHIVYFGLLGRPWYRDQLGRRDPEIYALAARDLDEGRLSDAFIAMVTRYRGPAFTTLDLNTGHEPLLAPAFAALLTTRGVLPRGLVVQIVPDQRPRIPPPLSFTTRGLDPDDEVARTEFIPNYQAAVVIRERYLALIK